MTTTHAQLDIAIDPNIRTAIVYSIDDLGHYLVEIRFQNQAAYICAQRDPVIYKNLGDARQAARVNGAEIAILALSKTYDEVDVTTDPALNRTREKYDFMPLTLE